MGKKYKSVDPGFAIIVKNSKDVDPGFAIKVKGNYRDVDPGFYKTLPKRKSKPVRMPSPVIKKMSGK